METHACLIQTHRQTDTHACLHTKIHTYTQLIHFCPETYKILELSISTILKIFFQKFPDP